MCHKGRMIIVEPGGPGVGSEGGDKRLVEIDFSWKTWKVGWIFMDSGRANQIVEGLLIFSIGKEPLKQDKN